MYRRTRPKREIPFSFDSFLDVVANVCGIIIRLILVAGVGARSYHAIAAKPIPNAAENMTAVSVSREDDGRLALIAKPFEENLERERQQLTALRLRLAQQLARFYELETKNVQSVQKLISLNEAQKSVEEKRQTVEKTVQHFALHSAGTISADELTKRIRQVEVELREIEKLQSPTKTLAYRTPVSRPVHTEELHFECRGGRISFIDVPAFLIEIRRDLEARAKDLKTRWEVEGKTSAIGAFRLIYMIERERGLLDAVGLPNPDANFRYGLSAWKVEPITIARGEATSLAFTSGSHFRRMLDAVDPEQTVITLWVYPDSFALYREARDYLHERGVEVAGRPLPEGMPIASSRQGSASRVQ